MDTLIIILTITIIIIGITVYLSSKATKGYEAQIKQFEDLLVERQFNTTQRISYKGFKIGQELYIDVLIDSNSEQICIRKTSTYLYQLAMATKDQSFNPKEDSISFIHNTDIRRFYITENNDVILSWDKENKQDVDKATEVFQSEVKSDRVKQLDMSIITENPEEAEFNIKVIFKPIKRVSSEYKNAYRFVEELYETLRHNIKSI